MHEFSLSRRRFALGAAAAATTAMILPGEAISQSQAAGQAQASAKNQASPPSPPATTLEQQAQAAMAKLSAQAQAEVEMKLREIMRKYGDKLSDEQKTDIRKVLAETQDGLEKMRAFALDNGDQPATVFQPFRGEGNR